MSISYQQGIQNNSCLTDLSTKSGNTEVYLRTETTQNTKQKRQKNILNLSSGLSPEQWDETWLHTNPA